MLKKDSEEDDKTVAKDSSNNEGLDFKQLAAPVTSATGLKVAWLMAFASSGTTCTSKLIPIASQTAAGANYGNEYVNVHRESVSLCCDIKGPCIADENLSVLSSCILTKPHCGSCFTDFSPNDYVENACECIESYLRAPRERMMWIPRKFRFENGVIQSLEFDSYDPSIACEIMHAINDPFNNAVLYFHHECKSLVQKFDSKDKFPYSYNKEGFQEYCKDKDKCYLEEEKTTLSENMCLISKHALYHACFYQYV